MYRKQPFTMRQYTGFGNAADTNRRFKFLIANGQTGLNVAFDLPRSAARFRRPAWPTARSAASAWRWTPCATSRSPSTASTSTRSPSR
jgi:hypothetical protein